MAIDFPSSPSIGQTFTVGGLIYTWDGVAWNLPSSVQIGTADAENAILNPSMQISQQNGATAGNTNNYHPVDQWYLNLNTTGVVNVQQVAAPAGVASPSPSRLRCTVATADTSIAAGEYFCISQKIEGVRSARFKYGTAYAKQTILRFGFKGPAGTYSVNIRNANATRSYVTSFTISAAQANTDTEQVLIIPGDVTGTWNVDNTLGLQFGIALASGTTYAGVAGWQAGNFLSVAAQSNGLATVGNVFELWDAGLYLDPDNTGVPPPYRMPDFEPELAKCQRYWYASVFWLGGYNTAATGDYYFLPCKVSMRTTPSSSYSVSTSTNCTIFDVRNPGTEGVLVYVQPAATGSFAFSGTMTLNARM